MNSTIGVKQVSECFIKPKYELVDESKHSHHLSPWDLAMLSLHYIQKGLLFQKPSFFADEQGAMKDLLESLKDSLSLTLVHFYPLAGQLVTRVDEDQAKCLVFVDCNKGPGARFIHADLPMNMSDILSPTDVPVVVQSLFDHVRAVNHDGHTRSLLSVQVTELIDGVFIGVSMNHAIVDGTSYWHFWNAWSEIHRANGKCISLSHPPFHKYRWFLDGYGSSIHLPFTHPDEFISRYEAPELRHKIFHFSPESIVRLKEKANEEIDTNKISSFQALTALVWRSIARASNLSHDEVTICGVIANNRQRLDPPLPESYFGNSLSDIKAIAVAGELLEQNLGWTASLVHQCVANHDDKVVRDFLKRWLQSPFLFHLATLPNSYNVVMISSPRFDMYGNEFGLGKAVGVRSGYANKYPGNVTAYPGYEGGGSVDLEICLPPDCMRALESDEEFMAVCL